MPKDNRPERSSTDFAVRSLILRRQNDEKNQRINKLEQQVVRPKQRERTPPRHDPRPPGGSFDGGWMGW